MCQAKHGQLVFVALLEGARSEEPLHLDSRPYDLVSNLINRHLCPPRFPRLRVI